MSKEISVTFQLNADIEYTVTSWGTPESGPTYSSGGEPAEPPEYEIDSIKIEGKEFDWNSLPNSAQDMIDQCIYEELAEGPDDDYDE